MSFCIMATGWRPFEVLDEPLMAVLSEKSAMRLYGRKNVVGEVLLLKGNTDARYQVTGVFKDLPANSHIQFEVLLSNEIWMKSNR